LLLEAAMDLKACSYRLVLAFLLAKETAVAFAPDISVDALAEASKEAFLYFDLEVQR
jgi:hypothetical protein